jgi:hypothetical protein
VAAEGVGLSEEEVANFRGADDDFGRAGSTDRRCLRCGARLVLEERGSGYVIHCEREPRVRSTFRGI